MGIHLVSSGVFQTRDSLRLFGILWDSLRFSRFDGLIRFVMESSGLPGGFLRDSRLADESIIGDSWHLTSPSSQASDLWGRARHFSRPLEMISTKKKKPSKILQRFSRDSQRFSTDGPDPNETDPSINSTCNGTALSFTQTATLFLCDSLGFFAILWDSLGIPAAR